MLRREKRIVSIVRAAPTDLVAVGCGGGAEAELKALRERVAESDARLEQLRRERWQNYPESRDEFVGSIDKYLDLVPACITLREAGDIVGGRIRPDASRHP